MEIFEKRRQKRIYRAKSSGTRRETDRRILVGIFYRVYQRKQVGKVKQSLQRSGETMSSRGCAASGILR